MHLKPLRQIPFLVAGAVIMAACFARWLPIEFFERLELMSFDMRVRNTLRTAPPAATNLGFVYIDEASIARVRDGSLGYKFGLYWPRQVYGRLTSALADEGARYVGFDVVFGELRPDHPLVQLGEGKFIESDEYFALQMRRASNVIMAVTPDLVPPALFLTNAAYQADISTQKDTDGILRRARAFRMYREWHPAFRNLEQDPEYGVDLKLARAEPNRIVLPRQGAEGIIIPLDSEGRFDLADFYGDSLPENMARKAAPYSEKRVWHMGIAIAAAALGLDLEHANVNLPLGRIVLSGPGGLQRSIPVDEHGLFYIDWSLPLNHAQLTREPAHQLLARERLRLEGQPVEPGPWKDKLAIIGSSALANDLSDRGATPISPDTLLVSKHWNVANSLLLDRFVRRTTLLTDLLLIIGLTAVAALLTWNLRALTAALSVMLAVVGYVFLAVQVYQQNRLWLPLAIPVLGSMLTTHALLLSWRVVLEQAERRRVRSVFSKMVSPKIVNELLSSETLSLGGSRREITVLFTDVRGFTQWTDRSREELTAVIREQQLEPGAAEALYDEQAREALATINQYLGMVADIVKQHDGTLDKFIGDCVMAFWGAPVSNPRHASACVRAAIALQRAIHDLNQQRQAENERRLRQAGSSAPSTGPALSSAPLPILTFGTGVNTGFATAGLMGSAEAESLNYTVFGREVNLASRLEGASGHSRIFIGPATYEHLRRDEPGLAEVCVPLPPLQLKGFASALSVYEVRWRPPGDPCGTVQDVQAVGKA